MSPLPRLLSRPASLRRALVLACSLAIAPPAAAQNTEPLRLGGVQPGGVRSSATESWGAFDFTLTNHSDTDRQARVFTFYEGQTDVQYGRDLWVPAHSSIATWMLVGPTPKQSTFTYRGVEMVLYERTGDKERLILPSTEERVRSRGVGYRTREPYTTVLLDEDSLERRPFGQMPQHMTAADEALRFARVMRSVRKLSEYTGRVNPGPLPPAAEAFDGINHFVLASNRLADDPAGMQALRRWLERGGKVWVMLDLVEPETLAPLLGDALDFQVVDRVSLTNFWVEVPPSGARLGKPPLQAYDRPVDFARVLLPPQERPKHVVGIPGSAATANPWPAWFARSVGRGRVVFTTLGPRAWFRDRQRTDPPSPFEHFTNLPIAPPSSPLEDVAAELQPAEAESFGPENFRAQLTDEIGYAVPGRSTVGLIFGAFLLATLGLAVGLRRWRRPELVGWLGPVAALVTAVVFLVLGGASRQAVPATVAVAQIVDADSGTEEASVRGLLAVYRPDSGPAEIGAREGGHFDLDMTGTQGQMRRLVMTDRGAWHWENLSLPAGVRFAPFQQTVHAAAPLTAKAHFGPAGLEGKLAAGPFRGLADAILCTPGGRNLAVRLHPDGAFEATGQDILAKGQFLASAVLDDRQKRRQDAYREFLKKPGTGRLEGRTVLLAWAEPADLNFMLAPEARTVGTALLVLPLQLERPAVGARITIPGPLLPYQRVMFGGRTRPAMESPKAIDMHLRFQLPPSVLPLKVEKARLVAKVDAPSRRVIISGMAGMAEDKLVEVGRADSPLDPVRVEIAEERLLQLDADGGLHLNFSVSDPLGGPKKPTDAAPDEKWVIEYLELEVSGRLEG